MSSPTNNLFDLNYRDNLSLNFSEANLSIGACSDSEDDLTVSTTTNVTTGNITNKIDSSNLNACLNSTTQEEVSCIFFSYK